MPAADAAPDVVHLCLGGTSLLVRLDRDQLPVILHWGPDLGEPTSLADLARAVAEPGRDKPPVGLLPQHSAGWLGRPGLWGSRAGRAWSVAFDTVEHSVLAGPDPHWPDAPAQAMRIRSVGTDVPGGLEVATELAILPSGLVQVRAAVRNLGDAGYELQHVDPALPVPADADELLDMAGRWAHERTPQRRPFDVGRWAREAWGGRPGHDSPTVLCAGAAGFGFRTGRVWGVHLAWSGNQAISAERSTEGTSLLRGGELLLPGEVVLDTGQQYVTPWLIGSWGDGLDELAARFHRHLRSRDRHPAKPRPVLLNTWEAVYFDHDLTTLLALADKAASIGIERFVLDDGWFRHRRDDRAGLGDWFVDEGVWPDGLHPLVDRVHQLGMDFGLWFEPEMVNLDSDLARAHPEWVFQTEHGPGLAARYQHVLDLGHPQAYDHVRQRMDALIGEYDIAYVKWDHNRALADAGHGPDFAPGVHVQVEAAYRLMDELRARHPGLEIESCCSGGGRLDLAMMQHADRVWVSDCIDAHERHRMVRWTGLILPPELMGTHVGDGADHTTGRAHSLTFRAGTAIWGHLGVEWDLTSASDQDLAALADWIRFHKEHRSLLHSGDVVHADLANPALQLEGVVARDGSAALYRLSALDWSLTWPPGLVPLPGLDPGRTYLVELVGPPQPAGPLPAWVGGGVVMSGRALAEIGVQAPPLPVADLVLIRASAVRFA